MSADRESCSACSDTRVLRTSSWDDDGFPCPECTQTLNLRWLNAVTGEVKEAQIRGVEHGDLWERTSLELALMLVPDLEVYIDLCRMRGVSPEVRFGEPVQ